ncbi:MAG: DUF4013 domain-containing protein [Candidatus Omnitrophica bacterium]|nr:DUF4013 domain-containing protein [Candidatus Omnitrophota bacterium]
MRKKILDAFRATVKTRRNTQDILVGGLLLILPLLQFIAIGFLMKKLERILRLDKTPVQWEENLRELFCCGLIGAGIAITYLAIPVLLMILGGFFTTTLSGGKILSLSFIRGQVINLLMILFFLLATFLLPFALASAVETRNLSRAFNIPLILDRIFLVPKDYLIIYSVILTLYIGSFAIIFLLTNIIVGLLLSGFILFYAGYASIHLLGKIFPRQSVSIPAPNNEPQLFFP